MNELGNKEKTIIIGDLEADDDEKDVLTMNPKKPFKWNPNLQNFRLRWNLASAKPGGAFLTRRSRTPATWKVSLGKNSKQKFIEREAEMCKIFSREHKCLRLNNLRVTDSKFNAHITLPKALSQDKEVYINLRRETFTKTMKRYLK